MSATQPLSSEPRPTLLVIDDEPKIRAVVCDALAGDIARCSSPVPAARA